MKVVIIAKKKDTSRTIKEFEIMKVIVKEDIHLTTVLSYCVLAKP